ncbi:hypothetical protein C0Z16_33810 [Paraburkholderia rhynchosiae]|uniref:Uncharacterized protein n=1 Tax=Paraburkholderia rhynchosiae TaxID=487049 RepID=A0ABX4UUE9_9BURK|nr:hypothetical protein C0Z16_33810 [Paraburkholderia rhynchosiae]
MQNDLVGLYRFTRAEILEVLAGPSAALFGIDLPADNRSAEHVHKEIKYKCCPRIVAGRQVMSQLYSWFGASAQTARGLLRVLAGRSLRRCASCFYSRSTR